MATPLINPLRVSGGTMYAFSSAVRDMQKSLMDNDIVFSFSKFALLDLPNVNLPLGGTSSYENKIVWQAVSGTDPYQNSDLNLAESFENYLLNFENIVLTKNNSNGGSYDNTILQSTTERLFWKWLTKINAIKFQDTDYTKSNITNRYEELVSTDYSNVVKYIGDIDVVNNNSFYTEVYINVPSNHGNTPTVLFKTISDANYNESNEWFGTSNYIDGRSESSVHPAGLSLLAFYDYPATRKYQAGATFGSTTFTQVGVTGATLMISDMDGAVIDFDTTSYTQIDSKYGITNFGEFNASDSSGNFDFNVVLVYYNTYRQSNPSVVYRNLYGMLVLDNYINGTEYDELKRFSKYKANVLTGLNGNSYSLKFNMKLDTSVANLGVEKIINDYNTFSMELFSDAMMQLTRASATLESQANELIGVKTRLTSLENFYFSQDDLDTVNARISSIESSLASANMAFSDKNTLLGLINTNADNINSILSGSLSLNLSYNTDVLYSGSGIELDKSVKNKITIKNVVQSYNSFPVCKNDNIGNILSFEAGNGTLTDTVNGNIIPLGEYVNYYRYDIEDKIGINALTRDLVLNIEDKDIKWKKGQIFKIYFNKKIDLNSHIISIRTDYSNSYKTIAAIDSDALYSQKPIIEIVCTDSNALLFDINILR